MTFPKAYETQTGFTSIRNNAYVQAGERLISLRSQLAAALRRQDAELISYYGKRIARHEKTRALCLAAL